jgi:tRNA(Ile)-lysidine synthase
MVPDEALVDRFRADLDALIAPDARIGIAVSGGADSLALLLLANAARSGQVEAATVDHALRLESRVEAETVAGICALLDIPHTTLTARWNGHPQTAIQERARGERYRLLGYWAEERGLGALATGHQADDQAETLLMRLSRGAGVRGLGGMRPRSVTPGSHIRLVRPLLGWRRVELERICVDAGLTPASDPSNRDVRFERVRIRNALGEADWLDPAAVARSAAHLADANSALDWAAKTEWKRAVRESADSIIYRATDAPAEILRRIVGRAVRKLATEGDVELRGPELDRLLTALAGGETATIRGVLCRGGPDWRFSRAPERQS